MTDTGGYETRRLETVSEQSARLARHVCTCECTAPATHLTPSEWEQADDCPVHPLRGDEDRQRWQRTDMPTYVEVEAELRQLRTFVRWLDNHLFNTLDFARADPSYVFVQTNVQRDDGQPDGWSVPPSFADVLRRALHVEHIRTFTSGDLEEESTS